MCGKFDRKLPKRHIETRREVFQSQGNVHFPWLMARRDYSVHVSRQFRNASQCSDMLGYAHVVLNVDAISFAAVNRNAFTCM